MSKCEICSEKENSNQKDLVLQPSGYYLCPTHEKAIADRQAKAKLHLAVLIDEQELKGLRAEGLTTMRFYVYMALRVDGIQGSMKAVQIPTFCQRWALSLEDFISAIASLSKKGIVVMDLKGLDAQAITHKERIESMEKGIG